MGGFLAPSLLGCRGSDRRDVAAFWVEASKAFS